jgi:hypothetical protein
MPTLLIFGVGVPTREELALGGGGADPKKIFRGGGSTFSGKGVTYLSVNNYG